jgi:hypothetical protein
MEGYQGTVQYLVEDGVVRLQLEDELPAQGVEPQLQGLTLFRQRPFQPRGISIEGGVA